MKTENLLLTYPAVFFEAEEGGYSVEVPDLPGCISEGDTLAEAINMITDAASGWVLDELEDGKKAPDSSSYNDICKRFKGETVSVIVLDMASYAEKFGKKSVRKNVTIPSWLNTFAEDNKLSLSEVLQNALVNMFNAQ